MSERPIRCAIYTRKSSEEGLDQSFNSLGAQREACHAFFLSQKHEGWAVLSSRYDDGGVSGGTMDRPGLTQLLNDIVSGKIDTVVVYKVDRLTRSLADFAKIIETFDAHSVSFVSVTQQFNTTTSMGRLTLNVLLSFAQFEREITGERIRDKIAASKKKGMWMGGNAPLGYNCMGRELLVNRPEAKTVRLIFRQYVELGCVKKLKEFLDSKAVRSKILKSKAGRTYGGVSYSRGALYHMLKNRVYIGETVHRKESYRGRHPALVPRELWDQVAAKLQRNNQAHRSGGSRSTPSLLSAKLFDENGVRFTPTHVLKNGKRYRYYTSQTVLGQSGLKPSITRFPAQELEQFVKSQIHLLLQAPDKCTAEMEDSPHKAIAAKKAENLGREWPSLEISKQHQIVRNILRRVAVGERRIWIQIDRAALVTILLGKHTPDLTKSCLPKSELLKLASDFQPIRRGSELRIITPQSHSSARRIPVPSIVKAIARGRSWYQDIVAGNIGTVEQLAHKLGLSPTYVKRILQFATHGP